MARRRVTDRGGDHSGGVISGGTMTRTRRATGEALLAPSRKRRSQVRPITTTPGKGAEGERVAEGPAVARKGSNVPGAIGPRCSAMPPTTRKTFSGPVSSEFFRALPQLLPRHCRQVVRLVIRHLAFPQDEDDLHPLRAQRPEGLTMLVASRPLLVVIRPGPLARAQREEGHLIDYGPQGLVAGEAEVDDLLLAALHGHGHGASVRLQMLKRLPPGPTRLSPESDTSEARWRQAGRPLSSPRLPRSMMK